MKYMSLIKNARSKAKSFFRSGFAFVLSVAFFLALFVSLFRYINTTRANEIRAKNGIYRMMESDMAKCARIGVKMQYAGAKIENELLPELEIYLYSLKGLTQAFYESFGEEDSPICIQFLSKIESAKERLERDYDAGYPAKDAEKALQLYLNELSEILDKWDFE